MRKVMALVLALVLVFALVPMSVSARTLTAEEKDLFAKLSEHIQVKDGEFALPAEVITQGENYVAALATPLTAPQIQAILAEFEAAKALVKSENTGVAANWSATTRGKILDHINTAAQEVGCTAQASPDGGIVIKNAAGQPVVTNDKLVKKTGFGVEGMVIAGLCTVVALSACAFVSKKVELF